MEQFINNKKYLLIFILFIVLLLIIIISFILKSNQTNPPGTLIQPTIVNIQPTSVVQQSTTNNPARIATQSVAGGQQPIINPTAAAPAQFTGAKDIEFTETQANEIDQERNLRRTSPYTTQTFTITYNPADDIFEVQLSAPKDSAQNDFEVWRKINYSAVSLERFTFK